MSFRQHCTQGEGFFDPWALLSAMRRKAISMGVLFVSGEVVGAKTDEDAGLVTAVDIRGNQARVFFRSIHDSGFVKC